MMYLLSFVGGSVITLVILFVLAKIKIAKNEKIRKEKNE